MITRYCKSAILSASVFLLLASSAQAQTVVARYLEFGLTATDNPELLQQATDAELVATIKPSVELKFTGNRFGALVIGEVEHFHYKDADTGITDPRLLSRVRGTLVDNLLYFDTGFTYSKLAPESSFLRATDGREPAMKLSGRLFLFREFGTTAELYVGLDEVSNFSIASEPRSSREDSINFTFGRNPKYGGFLWGVGGYYGEDRSDSNQFKGGNVYGWLGGTLTRTFAVQVSGGRETREFIRGVSTVNPVVTQDGTTSTWNTSILYSPSDRTSLAVGYGERFFGPGPELELKHRTQNSQLRMIYSRGITRNTPALSSVSGLNSNDLSFVDPGNVEIDDTNVIAQLDEPFIDKTLRFSYKLTGRRSDIIFDAVYSEQDQIGGEDTVEVLLGRLVFDRRLSDLTSLRLQYDYQNSEAPQRTDRTYIENRFAVKFIYDFDKIDSSRDEVIDR